MAEAGAGGESAPVRGLAHSLIGVLPLGEFWPLTLSPATVLTAEPFVLARRGNSIVIVPAAEWPA